MHPKIEQACTDCELPFIGTKEARYCPNCRWRHRGRKAKKYEWTPERDAVLRARYDGTVKGRAAKVAKIFGWPRWVIVKRAATLGLCYPVERKDWTPGEVDFLMEYAGVRTAHWISLKLGRSETSVVLKFKRMKISRRVRGDGYTLRELVLCFGTDHHVIERWVREGKLKAFRRGTDRPRDPWRVSDELVLRFIKEHPLAFRLDKVDQTWFMGLMTDGGLIDRAIRTAKEVAA